MNVVDRIKRILLEPRVEWPRLAAEPATVQSIYTGWVMILGAITPIMLLLSSALFTGIIGFGLAGGVRAAVGAYINTLIVVAVLAAIVDVLAPSFGGSKDYVQSLKLVAFSFTAVWVAGIAVIVPVLGWLVVLAGAIYGFYLFFLGAPLTGRCAADKAVPYTVVVVLCAIVLLVIVQRILFALMGFGAAPPGAMGMLS